MKIFTWPFRKFFSYVCGKLLSGYVESEFNLKNFAYNNGALCLYDIALSPPVLKFVIS